VNILPFSTKFNRTICLKQVSRIIPETNEIERILTEIRNNLPFLLVNLVALEDQLILSRPAMENKNTQIKYTSINSTSLVKLMIYKVLSGFLILKNTNFFSFIYKSVPS
jgi:hypothetical protein